MRRPVGDPADGSSGGPVLTRRALGTLPLAAGRFLVAAYATPVPFHDYEVFTDLGVVTGIYLVTDTENHIRWLGQASRDDDLSARLGEHQRNPHKGPSSPTCEYSTSKITPRATRSTPSREGPQTGSTSVAP